jgi:hypothetical protein
MKMVVAAGCLIVGKFLANHSYQQLGYVCVGRFEGGRESKRVKTSGRHQVTPIARTAVFHQSHAHSAFQFTQPNQHETNQSNLKRE